MNRILIGLALLSPPFLNAASSSHQFLGWTDFCKFTRNTNSAGEVEWLSPKTPCRPADEFIPSWNAILATDGGLRVELRAFHGTRATRFYPLGRWSEDVTRNPRESVKSQPDEDGDVNTDTLQLQVPADAFQFKLTLGPTQCAAHLTLLAVSATDTHRALKPLPPLRSAWGKVLPVPTKSQMAYLDGAAWCSPTTVSMLLAFWSAQLERPDLALDVPVVAHGSYDMTWQGTGNWAFNMAFAGSLPGLRGCVTRFSDVRELETWIAHGYPAGISVCYDRLRGKGRGPNGHLMVCVGFARNGDVILNDPGTTHEMQKTFSRERLMDAWASSRNTVYLVYPAGAKLPRDQFGHWTIREAK